jgi:riboflavin kinase/FMN adenylyltransferase
MKVFRSYTTVDPAYRGCVLAIGNFDGVHRGHQIVLDRAKKIAADLGTKTAVLTLSHTLMCCFNLIRRRRALRRLG